MVANHARKKLARQLIDQSEGRLSYIEAMRYAGQLNAFQVELATSQGDSSKSLAVARNQEDMLTALRFAQSTMAKRYQEMEAAGINSFMDLPDHGRSLMIMVNEFDELLSSPLVESVTEDQRAESLRLIGAIARQGREVAVELIVGVSRPHTEV